MLRTYVFGGSIASPIIPIYCELVFKPSVMLPECILTRVIMYKQGAGLVSHIVALGAYLC